MQFITNGPDVPEALLQAHEEGRAVFFCGAGISNKVGLKDFKWLVDKIYCLCGTKKTTTEADAYNNKLFDTTLNILEERLPGQRRGLGMRKALAQALQPDLNLNGATETHSALLQLAHNHKGALRLVTTNFDRTFEKIARCENSQFNSFSAPMLPIPKNSQWDGLVYLHGLLPDENEDESALDKLVVTSGDFGLAYLTERWAARFVSELFRNYVVCFIGYSINDPVLRYMMDAIAADRLRGESTPKAYALAAYKPAQKNEVKDNWRSKGVIPVLYHSNSSHACLHNTLKAWAADYRDGVRGKEQVVVKHATINPSESTEQDDFVGRMLWALSDKSGLPAKRFADFDPVPPLTWLETFSEPRYRQEDLSRFGVPPHTDVDNNLRFSFIRRPAPYNLALWMMLDSGVDVNSQWDEVMHHLARWLVRHLNDPKLIIWLTQYGDRLHDQLAKMIEPKLDDIAGLEAVELKAIHTYAPNSIPCPQMQTLWRLLLADRVKSYWTEPDLYHWINRVLRDGVSTSLRLELRELLAPKIALREPFLWSAEENSKQTPNSIKHLVDWDLVLTADHVNSSLPNMEDTRWRNVLPQLLNDFQQLLEDALGLFRELGEADEWSDRSHWDLPSISPHWQNRHLQDWATLIELLRDSWLVLLESDAVRAIRIAQSWFDQPYPTFKRLALYAASQDYAIESDVWVKWLVDENAWWLWSIETQRETMRLLVLQAHRLSPEAKANLEATILAGPPRAMFRDDIDPDKFDRIVKNQVRLYLAKLAHKEEMLSPIALSCLLDVPPGRSEWKSERNEERNEFSIWMSGTGDPDYEESRATEIAPRKRRELAKWLKQPPPSGQQFYEDTWRDTCRTRFFHSLFAFCDLSRENQWPTERWGEALQVWSEEGHAVRSWRFAGPLVRSMPNDTLQELGHGVSWWLKAVSKSIERHETILLALCDRLLDQPNQSGVISEPPVTTAINHPVGHVTQALLNIWFMRNPNDNDLLPEDIKPFFTRLCDSGKEQFRHGRVLLASRLIALFRVDQSWTETHLLPHFNWSTDPNEAKAVWEGFLWSPRLHRPLLSAFKSCFLDTANHYAELDGHKEQFAQFLTYAALDPVEDYSTHDLQIAMEALPQEGLQIAAQALRQALDGAGEQREDYWKNRIQPFWQKVWPQSHNLVSDSIAKSLAFLAIAARGEFAEALNEVLNWLQGIMRPHYVLKKLNESDLINRFPNEVLKLLDVIIDDQSRASHELRQCLESIAKVSPELREDPRYKKLEIYARKHGI